MNKQAFVAGYTRELLKRGAEYPMSTQEPQPQMSIQPPAPNKVDSLISKMRNKVDEIYNPPMSIQEKYQPEPAYSNNVSSPYGPLGGYPMPTDIVPPKTSPPRKSRSPRRVVPKAPPKPNVDDVISGMKPSEGPLSDDKEIASMQVSARNQLNKNRKPQYSASTKKMENDFWKNTIAKQNKTDLNNKVKQETRSAGLNKVDYNKVMPQAKKFDLDVSKNPKKPDLSFGKNKNTASNITPSPSSGLARMAPRKF